MTRLSQGQRVRVRLEGSSDEWCNGQVVVASDGNPSSVGLLVEGMVRSSSGGWIGGGLPLVVDYEEETVRSLLGDLYEIEVPS
jgi:hypothetical protein